MSAVGPLLTSSAPRVRGPFTQSRAHLIKARRSWGTWPSSLRLGLAILIVLVALGALGTLVLDDPNRQQLSNAYAAPGSAGHLLGTDPLGRDVLSWLAGSVRTSVLVGLAVVMLSSAVGTGIGVLAGYLGGVADAVLMRLVDLQLAIPPLLLFVAASATVGRSMTALILLVSCVSWVPYARVVRTQVQVERRRASVAAAMLAGVTRRRLFFMHLLPAAGTLVLVLASLQFGFVLLWETGLSFVGLGIRPPTPSLGYLIAEGRPALAHAWWIVVSPGSLLALLLLAVNLVGEGLQELFGVEVNLFER